MPISNLDKLDSISFIGIGLTRSLSNDRYVKVGRSDDHKLWAIDAGNPKGNIAMCLSDEAMKALIYLYQEHMLEPTSVKWNIAVELKHDDD